MSIPIGARIKVKEGRHYKGCRGVVISYKQSKVHKGHEIYMIRLDERDRTMSFYKDEIAPLSSLECLAETVE